MYSLYGMVDSFILIIIVQEKGSTILHRFLTFFFGAGTGSVKAKNGRARLMKPFLYVPIFSHLLTS